MKRLKHMKQILLNKIDREKLIKDNITLLNNNIALNNQLNALKNQLNVI